MQNQNLPRLLVTRTEASKGLKAQIEKGKVLLNRPIYSENALRKAVRDADNWQTYNTTLLMKLFDSSVLTGYLDFSYDSLSEDTYSLQTPRLEDEFDNYRDMLEESLSSLDGVLQQLDEFAEPMDTQQNGTQDKEILETSRGTVGNRVFIGHGHSQSWRDLKDFIDKRLKLPCDEFSRVSTAGMTIPERLEEMLDEACIAFLVMTGEDEQADGTFHARMNVIHEVGLFQGRLGLKKAIILLEDGCEKFSNIHGVLEIRFPKGDIRATFEEIREVMEREGVLD